MKRIIVNKLKSKAASFILIVIILLCIIVKLLPVFQLYKIKQADDFLSQILTFSNIKTYLYDERGIIGESRTVTLAGGISEGSGITFIEYDALPDFKFENISTKMFSISIEDYTPEPYSLVFHRISNVSDIPNEYKESIVNYDGMSFIITVSNVAYDIDDDLIDFLLMFCEMHNLRTTKTY